jgi:hypothetical protein
MSNFPQRPQSHVRGDEAVRIFSSSCPSEWVISQIQQDYGLDLRIELTRNNQVTGEEFYVQVKGRKELEEKPNDPIEVVIAQSSVNYWLGKLHPVLVVVVDVSRQRFWFDWLEYAYADYPRTKEGRETVKLTLSRNSSITALSDFITGYLDDYFSRLRADLSRLFENTQLTRILLHTSALHRACGWMALTLQGREFTSDEELKDLFFSFYLEFGIHDEFLVNLWTDYISSEKIITQKLAETLKSPLQAYSQIRERFFMRESRAESGDFYFVPIRYSDLTNNLLPMLRLLSEIENILLQALILGEIVFPNKSE